MLLFYLVAAAIILLLVWFLTRQLSRSLSFGFRIEASSLLLVIGGLIVRQNEDGLIVALGAILTAVGLAFLIFGILLFIRAFLIGEFKHR